MAKTEKFRLVNASNVKSVGRRGKAPEINPDLIEGLNLIQNDDAGIVFDGGVFDHAPTKEQAATVRSKITSQWERMVKAGDVPNRKLNVYFVDGWANVRLNRNGSVAVKPEDMPASATA